jgi:NAD(P)-dependent dehydrogenase (short-subunit alcohol dehydrogenase family)
MNGKTIVVTGGFGALGSGVAAGAIDRGASVAVLDVAPSAPQALADRLGPKALLVGGVDLSSPEGAQKAMGAVRAKFGRLDALLNIAGGFQWEQVEDGSAESWDRMFALNLKTALNACKAALPHLLESGAGRIVNVGAQSALPNLIWRRPPRLAPRRRIWPLCRQQIRGASPDRKPGRGAEAERRNRQCGPALDHRHAGQPARHAECGL